MPCIITCSCGNTQLGTRCGARSLSNQLPAFRPSMLAPPTRTAVALPHCSFGIHPLLERLLNTFSQLGARLHFLQLSDAHVLLSNGAAAGSTGDGATAQERSNAAFARMVAPMVPYVTFDAITAGAGMLVGIQRFSLNHASMRGLPTGCGLPCCFLALQDSSGAGGNRSLQLYCCPHL